jgi:hypothetical protein
MVFDQLNTCCDQAEICLAKNLGDFINENNVLIGIILLQDY